MSEVLSDNEIFQHVFQAIPEPCAVLAPDAPRYTFLAVNEAYERCAGRSPDEVVGHGFAEVFPVNEQDPHSTNVKALRASFERVAKEGSPDSIGAYRYDIHRSSAEGGELAERWWSPRNLPLLDDNGEVIGILHRVEEVTEAVLLERADGKHTNPRSDSRQDSKARILIVESNTDWRLYLEQLCALKGEVRATDDLEAARDLVAEFEPDVVLVGIYSSVPESVALVRHLCTELEGRVPRVIASARSGSQKSRELALRCGADDVVFETGSAREILARVDAQLAGAVFEQEMAERSRRQIHELFMNAPAFIAIMEGPEHVYTLNNPAHNLLLKGRPIVGKTVYEVFERDNIREQLDMLDRVYETGEPFFAEEAPVPILDPETDELQTHYLTFVYLPTHDLDGNIDGVAAFGWDVTELVEARHLVEEQAAQLRAESRLKDEFLAMLGHELRNPLAPLATVADMLEMQGDEISPDRLAWVRDVIDRQVTQLSALVDDLLDVARISQGRIDIDREHWKLEEIIDGAVETIEPLVEGRHQSLEVVVPVDGLTIDVDKTRIIQVISNLLHNATKFTDEGGHIRLEVEGSGHDLTIAVEDDGAGIDPNMLPHVFDLFRQSNTSIDRSHGGLGLGLTLVRRLIEMHGGTVCAHSDGKGRGSRFEITLPVVVDATAISPLENEGLQN
ncbi:PAS domain-containing sensor histidine kinase [Persicimonas caeni]|nr:ATP-binding protein [Persicimonas caeni]